MSLEPTFRDFGKYSSSECLPAGEAFVHLPDELAIHPARYPFRK